MTTNDPMDSLPFHERQILQRALSGGLLVKLPRTARLEVRDEEIRSALTCHYSSLARTVACKELAREFAQYLSSGWRHEASIDQLPPETSMKRAAFHRIAHLSDGASLAWRQIYNILDGNRGR